jgi:putative peptidoglycan lipid II flippase
MQLSAPLKKLVWQFMSGNFLSKVSGLCRDVTMAAFFGADAIVAAFIVSYRMANLLRRLFGEGALVSGFIPHFESLKVESEQKAFDFFFAVIRSMGIILIGLIALFECLVVGLHLFADLPIDTYFMLDMTAVMFPSLLFICFYGIFSGVLQSYKKFFLTSIAPVVFNCSWILVMLFSRGIEKHAAMLWLSAGVLLGFFLQFFFTAIWVKKVIQERGITFHLSGGFASQLKPLFAALIAGVIGVGATQINNALDVIFARMASLEGPAYLTFGIRVQQLPLSVFIIALSSVMLPQLSKLASASRKEEYIAALQSALYRAFFVLIPMTAMCVINGGAFINAIYGRGGFTQKATLETTYALWAYGGGLLPMGLVLLVASAFYALKDYRTPSIASLTAVLVNLALNSFFVNYCRMNCSSVAIATAVAAAVNSLWLLGSLHWKIGPCLTWSFMKDIFKMAGSTLIAAGLTIGCSRLLFHWSCVELLFDSHVIFPRHLFAQLYELVSSSALFVASYLMACKLFGVDALSLGNEKKPVQANL